MAEYIERDAVLSDLEAAEKHGGMGMIIANTLKRYVKRVPSADVAPVVHAKWEHTHTSESYFNECWRCSACGFDDTEGFVFEFCPHCGAKMDLEG